METNKPIRTVCNQSPPGDAVVLMTSRSCLLVKHLDGELVRYRTGARDWEGVTPSIL